MNLVSISRSECMYDFPSQELPFISTFPTRMITDWQRYLCDWQNNLKVFCTCVTSHVVERSRFPCSILCRYKGAAARFEFDVLPTGPLQRKYWIMIRKSICVLLLLDSGLRDCGQLLWYFRCLSMVFGCYTKGRFHRVVKSFMFGLFIITGRASEIIWRPIRHG
jgi:hypothetical protein